jgi:hypothetical protein
MKTSFVPVLFAAALVWAAAPIVVTAGEDHDHDHAGHSHHEPRHGGLLEEAGGLDYELVVKPGLTRLYVSGHDEPVSLKGGKATITFLRGGQTSKIVLLPVGSDYFEAKGDMPSGAGVRAVALVLIKGKSASVRFAYK